MPPKYKKKTEYQPNNVFEKGTSSYLIIVESPSKCKKIEHYLGPNYKCIASKGHLREIDGLKSINVKKHFEITFSNVETKQSHIKEMQRIINQYLTTHVYLATDDDREGESISWHICQLFGLPIETTPRILFHEITETAIKTAILNPTRINMSLVYAQHARQVLDIIVGYKISPFLWKYLYNNKDAALSAGRCQTPALRLVYDNEKERETSVMEKQYKTIGYFFSKNIGFTLNHEFTDETCLYSFLEKSKEFPHLLTICSRKESIKHAPQPLNTSRLLQMASSQLHLSPKQTMSYSQQLYQDGHITYMRTDSVKYSKEFLHKIKEYIETTWSREYVGSLDKLENKDTSNPHEAIRVTHIHIPTIASEDTHLVALYKLIWRTTVESCMKDAIYNNTEVQITAPDQYLYTHIIEIPVFMGWKKADIKKEQKTITDTQNQETGMLFYLQAIEQQGTSVLCNEIESIVTAKHIHSHYTESSLIKKLEDLGIGRPSTFSTIIETLKERDYVVKKDLDGTKVPCIEYKLSFSDKKIERIEKEKVFGNEKGKLVIQPVGILAVEFLITHFNALFSYEYTNEMEMKLDLISNPSLVNNNWYDICNECYNNITTHSKNIKIDKRQYKIEDEYELVFQQYGPVLRKKASGNNNEDKNEDNNKDNNEDNNEDNNHKYEYKSIKKDINLDLEKLKRGEYKLDELLEVTNLCLGSYKEFPVYLKNGRYGPYVEWNEKKESIKQIEKEFSQIQLADIIPLLEPEKVNPENEVRSISTNKNILRIIDTDMSIRKGKYGAYIFYKTETMKNAQFYNLNQFNKGFLVCDLQILKDWIKEKHNIP